MGVQTAAVDQPKLQCVPLGTASQRSHYPNSASYQEVISITQYGYLNEKRSEHLTERVRAWWRFDCSYFPHLFDQDLDTGNLRCIYCDVQTKPLSSSVGLECSIRAERYHASHRDDPSYRRFYLGESFAAEQDADAEDMR